MKFLAKIISRLTGFFKELGAEIKKATQKAQEPTLTLGEFKEILSWKNKNELVAILVGVGADIDRTLPVIDNKREIKKTYSKKTLIKAIMLLIEEKYKLGEQYAKVKREIDRNGNTQRVSEKQKDRGPEGVLRRDDAQDEGRALSDSGSALV